jgi:hypothetical protein
LVGAHEIKVHRPTAKILLRGDLVGIMIAVSVGRLGPFALAWQVPSEAICGALS